jgi:PAS domain S-box-containing protein
LRKSESFLKETQEIAQLGTYSLDIISNSWTSSEILDSIFGIPSDFDRSFEGWVSITHPDWQEDMHNYVLNEVIGRKIKFDKKYEIIRYNDKEIRWVHGLGELIFDDDKLPILLIGTIQDITDRVKDEEALRQSEEKYRKIFDNVQDVFYQVNMSGIITDISPSVKYFSEFNQDEIVGMPAEILYSNSVDREIMLNELLKKGELRDYEIELKTRTGIIRNISMNTRLILDSDGKPIHIDGALRDITERKKGEEALKSSQLELKQFASHLQNVREEEKLQLAREIHDELGQILIAIKIDLGMMKQNVLKSIKSIDAENILTKFDNLFGLVDNTLNTTRKIMTDLRPEVLFLIGFVEAVKLYVNNYKERHQIICMFETTVSKLELNSQQSVALYRILQESLTNIAKHAKATRVDIHLDLLADKLVMKVNDNGIGFKMSQKNSTNSYGLLGMKERVYLLEGNLHISSQPGEGTTIKVEIPYQN